MLKDCLRTRLATVSFVFAELGPIANRGTDIADIVCIVMNSEESIDF
jgi:hypothetical protein